MEERETALVVTPGARYRSGMGIWNDLNRNLKESSREWVDWARQHAHEIGEAGLRHIERQDLLAERKQLLHRVGETVADRFLVENKKTLRRDSPGVAELLERVEAINTRLDEIALADQTPESGDPPET